MILLINIILSLFKKKSLIYKMKGKGMPGTYRKKTQPNTSPKPVDRSLKNNQHSAHFYCPLCKGDIYNTPELCHMKARHPNSATGATGK